MADPVDVAVPQAAAVAAAGPPELEGDAEGAGRTAVDNEAAALHAALNTVSVGDLRELKSLSRPPDAVVRVVTAVAIIVGAPSDAGWADGRRLLADPTLVRRLREFDPAHVRTRTLEHVHRHYTSREWFDVDALRAMSRAATGLAVWVKAVVALRAEVGGASPVGNERKQKVRSPKRRKAAAAKTPAPEESTKASTADVPAAGAEDDLLARLVDARRTLDTLCMSDLRELRAFRHPPSVVGKVVAAVALLIGAPLDITWSGCAQLLADTTNFMKTLQQFDPAQAKPKRVERVRNEYTTKEWFDPDSIARTSIAAKGLAMWARAMVELAAMTAGSGDAAAPKAQRKKRKASPKKREELPPPADGAPAATGDLAAAHDALRGVQVAEITELQSFRAPPQCVINVISAVAIVLGAAPDAAGWEQGKRLLATGRQLLQRLVELDPAEVPRRTVLHVQKHYTSQAWWDVDVLLRSSRAAAGLGMWLSALVTIALGLGRPSTHSSSKARRRPAARHADPNTDCAAAAPRRQRRGVRARAQLLDRLARRARPATVH